MVMWRIFFASFTELIAAIESVTTSSVSAEPSTRATAPPESTPCVT